MYNLYALERNSWKAADRDKRVVKVQHIETDYLAPDTAEEIIAALARMEGWFEAAGVGAASLAAAAAASTSAPPPQAGERPGDNAGERPSDNGGDEDPEYAYAGEQGDEIPAPGMERHKRPAVLLKPRKAWAAYREMLRYYAVKTLIAYLEERPELGFSALLAELEPEGAAERVAEWVNMGGQIVPAFRVDALRAQIRDGKLQTWEAVHRVYDEFHAAYPLDRARHALGALQYLSLKPSDSGAFIAELDYALETRRRIACEVYRSRAKDFHDPFRSITYRNKREMDQVAGKIEDNFFVTLTKKDLARFEETVRALKERLTRKNKQKNI
jgi:hypothetical protein